MKVSHTTLKGSNHIKIESLQMNKCVHSCIIIFFAFSRVERNGVSIISQQTLRCKNTIDPQILFPSLIGYGIIISSVVLHVKYKTTSTETQQQ